MFVNRTKTPVKIKEEFEREIHLFMPGIESIENLFFDYQISLIAEKRNNEYISYGISYVVGDVNKKYNPFVFYKVFPGQYRNEALNLLTFPNRLFENGERYVLTYYDKKLNNQTETEISEKIQDIISKWTDSFDKKNG